MRIAMLGHKRIPSRLGGIEIVVEELAVRMAEMGHDVYIYNRNTGEKGQKTYKGVNIIEIPTFKKSSLNAMVYSLIATVRLLFRRYDVVHYHAEGPCVMLWLVKLFGKKTVATIHGLDWQRAKWGNFATKYLLLGEQMAAKYSDALIVLSKNMHNYFKQTYNRESILIPNGVNSPEIRQANLISKYGLSHKDYILFLARITPEKGLDYLLEAFYRIKTDKKLIIAGSLDDGSVYVTSIRKKAANDPRVKFVGFVEGQELDELFSNCYLYVLPSDIEGMPISLLEAVSFKTRVLVSDISENIELLNGYGNTFEKSNVDSLEEKLVNILNNPELYDVDFKPNQHENETQKQIESILAKHDWNTVTRDTLKLYESVIS